MKTMKETRNTFVWLCICVARALDLLIHVSGASVPVVPVPTVRTGYEYLRVRCHKRTVLFDPTRLFFIHICSGGIEGI